MQWVFYVQILADITGSLYAHLQVWKLALAHPHMASQAQPTPQHCHNVGANIASMSVPTLWQHSDVPVDTFKCPSNSVWTSRQRCVNFIPTLCFDQNPNVAAMLSQCWWMSVNIEITFRQCCVNVVATMGIMLRQRSGNVVWTLSQCWCPMLGTNVGNVVWMLSQHWCPILYLVGLGAEWQLHSNLNFLHIYYINMHAYIGTITSTNIYEWSYLPWQLS